MLENILLVLNLTVTSGAALGILSKGYSHFTKPIVEKIDHLERHIGELRKNDSSLENRIENIEEYLIRTRKDFRRNK